MSNPTAVGQHLAVLKRVLSEYHVGDVAWTDEDNTFIDRFEQLPFDFQIVQCLKSNGFKDVKGLEDSFGHRSDSFDLESFYLNVHPEDVEDVISTDIQLVNWLKNARNGSIERTLLTAQFRFSDRTGEYRSVSRNSFIIKKDGAGRAACVYHVFVDVTETEQYGQVKYRFQHPGKRRTTVHEKCNLGVDLTKREEEILRLIVKGMSSQEISNKLFISKETVYRHRKNMIKKTKSKNTKSLAMRAITEKWV